MKEQKNYDIEVDFYCLVIRVKAKNKAEARKKVKARLQKGTGVIRLIKKIWIDEIL